MTHLIRLQYTITCYGGCGVLEPEPGRYPDKVAERHTKATGHAVGVKGVPVRSGDMGTDEAVDCGGDS
jgi:hypothetical protein